MRIAILEDDKDQADLLKLWLDGEEHHCHCFAEASEFQKQFRHTSFDLVVLDWELPVSSGMDVLKWIRKNADWNIPVLFITVRHDEQDIVNALQEGADDFMTKPTSKAVTLARINALARRSATKTEATNDIRDYGVYKLDPKDGSISRNGENIPLTDRESRLAFMFFDNIGRLISRDHLLESVWGISSNVATRTVDTHVSRLRKKLDLSPETGWQLKAIYQHGYRLEAVGEDS